MNSWKLVWQAFSVIFYTILAIFLLVFLISLIIRIIKFNVLKTKFKSVIKPELVNYKFFRTSDNYELKLYGGIKNDSEYIILAIHDMFRTGDDFSQFINWIESTNKANISLISFDQRNCGKNIFEKRFNIANSINDLKEIIDEINAKYSNAKLILLGEGFGSHIATFFSNNEKIHKIILSNLILNNLYKNNLSFYLHLWWGTLFNSKKSLNHEINGQDLTDDKDFAKKIEDENQTKNFITVKDYFLWKKAIKVSRKNINLTNKQLYILLSNNDFYCKIKNLVKYFKKINKKNYQLEIIDNKKHYLLNTQNSKEIFDLIIKNL